MNSKQHLPFRTSLELVLIGFWLIVFSMPIARAHGASDSEQANPTPKHGPQLTVPLTHYSSSEILSVPVSATTTQPLSIVSADPGPYFLVSVDVPASSTVPDPELSASCAIGRDEGCVPPLKTNPPVASSSSNILFIPGTLTSRLYMKNPDGSERELWEPRSDLDIGPLAMNADGTSVNEIYTRDIIDRLYSNDALYGASVLAELKDDANAYGPFENFMDGLVSDGTIKEWRAFPYDWRYDVSDIVQNGTLVGTSAGSPTRAYLQDTLQELASTSPTGKVTIIAHSNGGLIAKALAIDLEKKNEDDLIDKIIMVGTPQFGTPKSMTDLLHGDEFTELGGLLMYGDTVRDAEKTMPGIYDLLPSPEYFSTVPTPVATFDSQKPADLYQAAIGSVVASFSQLSDFVTDAFHLDDSAGLPGSSKTPIALSSALVQKSEGTHDAIDAWMPPPGIQLFTIAGWGQLTPYQTNYIGTSGLTCARINFFVPVACSLLPQIEPIAAYTENGDDTVVAASARGLTANALFFNARKYSDDTTKMVVHKDLLSASPVQDALKDILTTGTSSGPYLSTNTPDPTDNSYTVVSAHSPVTILATDGDGNQTGIVAIGSLLGIYFEKEEIPGSSVQATGDEKFLYLPAGIPYTVSMHGYDDGTTTIDIDHIAGDGSDTLLSTFKDIPTTAATSAEFFIAADGTASSTLPTEDSSTGSQPISKTETSPTQFSASSSANQSASFGARIVQPMTRTVIHLLKNVSRPDLKGEEVLELFITLESGLNSAFMESTIFLSFVHFPH